MNTSKQTKQQLEMLTAHLPSGMLKVHIRPTDIDNSRCSVIMALIVSPTLQTDDLF